MSRRSIRTALVVLALSATSLGVVGGTNPAVASTNPVSVKAMLAKLPVRAETHSGSYSAARFGSWVHHDECTNVATDVLVSFALGNPPMSDDGCRILSGKWQSPWDHIKSLKLSTLTLAHAVQLKEAWVSGASAWSAKRRAAYLNDTSVSGNVLPVSTKSNRARGNREPAQWLPTWQDGRCDYVESWIAVKFQWHLSVDKSEKRGLTKLLATMCKNDDQKMERPPVPDVASLGSDVVPAPADTTTAPTPVPTTTVPTAVSTFPSFSSYSTSGEGPMTIRLPSGATAGSVSIQTHNNTDRSFILETVDSAGQATEMLASAYGDYTGRVAWGLWGSSTYPPVSVKVIASGSWRLSIDPLAAAAQMGTTAASSQVYNYSGGARNVTFTYPGSSNFIVSQFTAPGAGTVLINDIGKTTRAVRLAPGPSIVVVESSPPHDETYDIWTTTGLG